MPKRGETDTGAEGEERLAERGKVFRNDAHPEHCKYQQSYTEPHWTTPTKEKHSICQGKVKTLRNKWYCQTSTRTNTDLEIVFKGS